MPFCRPTWTSGLTHSRPSCIHRLQRASPGVQSHLILLRRQTMHAASLGRVGSPMVVDGSGRRSANENAKNDTARSELSLARVHPLGGVEDGWLVGGMVRGGCIGRDQQSRQKLGHRCGVCKGLVNHRLTPHEPHIVTGRLCYPTVIGNQSRFAFCA